MKNDRPIIAVIFGGRSSEHSISCLSASSVLAAIDRDFFEVVAVGITRNGQMFIQNGDPDLLQIEGDALPEVGTGGQQVLISTDPHVRGFVSADAEELPAAFSKIDAVFSVLHGPYGEDGTIQGIFEFADIPYVGSGVFASAAAMDKAHMKAMFKAAGLNIGKYEVITNRKWNEDQQSALLKLKNLGLPVFVKPARAGSSIGITKVDDESQLVAAIEEARRHDPKVIVEAAVVGREIECGVLVDQSGRAQASVPAEIIVHGEHQFYDFKAKYLEDSAELCVPANLDEKTIARVQAAAIDAFEALDCEGFARCDFFLTENGEILINEVNTLPGFTAISMFPRMWQASGMTYPKIVEALIKDALSKGTGLR